MTSEMNAMEFGLMTDLGMQQGRISLQKQRLLDYFRAQVADARIKRRPVRSRTST